MHKLYLELDIARRRVNQRTKQSAVYQFMAYCASKATKKNKKPLDNFNAEMEKLDE